MMNDMQSYQRVRADMALMAHECTEIGVGGGLASGGPAVGEAGGKIGGFDCPLVTTPHTFRPDTSDLSFNFWHQISRERLP